MKIKNMLSVLFLICLTTAAFSVNAKNLTILVAASEGGTTAGTSKIIAEELQQREYNVDLNIAGSCTNVERLLKKTNESVLVVWANAFHSPNQPCNIPTPTIHTVMNVFFYSPAYFCINPDIENGLNTNETLMLGINEEMPSSVQDKITKYNPNIKLVPYVNSGAIGTALVSGEIKGTITDQGLFFESNGLVKCTHVAHEQQINGVKPLSEATGNENINYSFVAYSFTKNMSPDERENLHDEISAIYNQNNKLRELYENKGLAIDIQISSLKEQLNFINNTFE